MRIDSHEISCLFRYFCKSGKLLNCRLLQNIGGALRVKMAAKAAIFDIEMEQFVSMHPS